MAAAAPERGDADLLVRGGGGVVFPMDVPPAGSRQRKLFDEHRAKGWLTILEGVIPDEPSAEPAGDPPSDDVEAMKVAELKAFADEHSIDLGDATKKADIIAAIEEWQGIDPRDSEDDDES